MLLIMVKPNVAFKVRVSEHMRVSARTGKNIKSTKNSAVRDHILVSNSIASFEDF